MVRWLVLLILVLALAACNTEEKEPDDVAGIAIPQGAQVTVGETTCFNQETVPVTVSWFSACQDGSCVKAQLSPSDGTGQMTLTDGLPITTMWCGQDDWFLGTVRVHRTSGNNVEVFFLPAN